MKHKICNNLFPLMHPFLDIKCAFGFLTRLPVGAHSSSSSLARTVWAFPLVGITIATLSVLFALLFQWAGMPLQIATLIGLFVMVTLTGGLHEDGLADCADGFYGGTSVKQRLKIMHDSRIGTYGVVALLFSLLMRWILLITLFELSAFWGVIIAAGFSRVSMVFGMWLMPNARTTGLSYNAGKPALGSVLVASLIALSSAFYAFGLTAVWPVITATLAAGFVFWIAWRKIGGQTGDVLGASQQISEIAFLIALVSALHV